MRIKQERERFRTSETGYAVGWREVEREKGSKGRRKRRNNGDVIDENRTGKRKK